MIAAVKAVARMAGAAGIAIREERLRRGLTLRVVADRAGVSAATIHAMESGEGASLHTYARVVTALGLRLSIVFEDPRRRDRSATGRTADLVHAAMGEVAAGHLRAFGHNVALDEPYQHYQLAGRADVLAWDLHSMSLLHRENRTAFPDFQAAIGAYNAKRAYLANDLARRLRLKRAWRSVTNVMVCLWSAELLRTMRARRASLLAVCPDPTSAFEAWWSRGVPRSESTARSSFSTRRGGRGRTCGSGSATD